MAMAINMDAWRLGSQDYWKSVEDEYRQRDQQRADDANARAWAQENRLGQEFGLRMDEYGATERNARAFLNRGDPPTMQDPTNFMTDAFSAPKVQGSSADKVAAPTQFSNPVTNNVAVGEGDRVSILQGELARASASGDMESVKALRRQIDMVSSGTKTWEPNARARGISMAASPAEKDVHQIYQPVRQALLGELANAKTPEERSRVEIDLASIEREMARTKVGLSGPATPVQSRPAVGLNARPTFGEGGESVDSTEAHTLGLEKPQVNTPAQADPYIAQLQAARRALDPRGRGALEQAAAIDAQIEKRHMALAGQKIMAGVEAASPEQRAAAAQRILGTLPGVDYQPGGAYGLGTLTVGEKTVNVAPAQLAYAMLGQHLMRSGKMEEGYKLFNAVMTEAQQNNTSLNSAVSQTASTTGANAGRAAQLKHLETVDARAQAKLDAAELLAKRQNEYAGRVQGVLDGYHASIESGNNEAAAIYANEHEQLRAEGKTSGLKVPDRLPSQGKDHIASVAKRWSDIEQSMWKSGAKGSEIKEAKIDFYEQSGFAPPAKMQVLESGRDPNTGKPLTEADVDSFNAQYPNTQVDKKKLTWLQPKSQKASQPKATGLSEFETSRQQKIADLRERERVSRMEDNSRRESERQMLLGLRPDLRQLADRPFMR